MWLYTPSKSYFRLQYKIGHTKSHRFKGEPKRSADSLKEDSVVKQYLVLSESVT